MAETLLRKYSVQERLNKQDLDLITILVSPDSSNGGSSASGDLLFQTAEIPNAVSVPGGTAILESCAMIVDTNTTGNVALFIMSENISPTDGGNMATGVALTTGDNTHGEMDAFCGICTISGVVASGAATAIGNAANIGMVCKAAAGSKSLYVFGVQMSSADYDDPSTMALRFGFVKD